MRDNARRYNIPRTCTIILSVIFIVLFHSAANLFSIVSSFPRKIVRTGFNYIKRNTTRENEAKQWNYFNWSTSVHHLRSRYARSGMISRPECNTSDEWGARTKTAHNRVIIIKCTFCLYARKRRRPEECGAHIIIQFGRFGEFRTDEKRTRECAAIKDVFGERASIVVYTTRDDIIAKSPLLQITVVTNVRSFPCTECHPLIFLSVRVHAIIMFVVSLYKNSGRQTVRSDYIYIEKQKSIDWKFTLWSIWHLPPSPLNGKIIWTSHLINSILLLLILQYMK